MKSFGIGWHQLFRVKYLPNRLIMKALIILYYCKANCSFLEKLQNSDLVRHFCQALKINIQMYWTTSKLWCFNSFCYEIGWSFISGVIFDVGSYTNKLGKSQWPEKCWWIPALHEQILKSADDWLTTTKCMVHVNSC